MTTMRVVESLGMARIESAHVMGAPPMPAHLRRAAASTAGRICFSRWQYSEAYCVRNTYQPIGNIEI